MKEKGIASFVLKVLVVAVMIFAIVLYIYVYETSIFYSVDGEMYYYEDEETVSELFIQFEGNRAIVFCVPDWSMNCKVEYSYHLSPWKKFLFGTYLSGNSLLSIRSAEYEGQPVTFSLMCEKAEYANTWCTEYAEVEEAVGEESTWVIYFTDDGAYFDGIYLKRIEEIPVNVEGWMDIIDFMSGEN